MRVGPRMSASRRRSSGGGFAYVGGANPAPPATISATKWRIRGLTNGGGSGNMAANEIDMAATAGGADQCSGGSAISSSDFSGSYDKSYAFDGNNSLYWVSSGGMPGAWIGYDFGAAKTVYEIRYLPRPGAPHECPATGYVDYWDGAAWQVAWPLGGQLWTDGVAKVLRQPATGSRWRVNVTAASGGAVLGFAEVQMRTVIGGPDICTAGDPMADSYYASSGTWSPKNAYDDNTSTDWATGGANVGAWVGYDFYEQKEILEFVLTARGGADGLSGGATFSFERWKVETSSWEVVWTEVTSGFSGGQTKTFTRPSV